MQHRTVGMLDGDSISVTFANLYLNTKDLQLYDKTIFLIEFMDTEPVRHEFDHDQ